MPMDSATQPGTSKGHILVGEDDDRLRAALLRILRFEGYEVDEASDGAESLEKASKNRYDVIILDVMMPFVDGIGVCRRLREHGIRTPILMLTAKVEISDRVDGLDAGADDYLTKPYAIDELLARIRSLQRRTEPDDAQVLRLEDLIMDTARRTVMRGDHEIELTKTEFDLLEVLIANAGIVLSRDRLYDLIWGYDFETSSKSLDVYIGYLRKKLESDDAPRLIHTVRGVGYVARRA